MERRIGEEENLAAGLGSESGRRRFGTSGRRLIDGREETREERRIRKGSLDGPEGTEGELPVTCEINNSSWRSFSRSSGISCRQIWM